LPQLGEDVNDTQARISGAAEILLCHFRGLRYVFLHRCAATVTGEIADAREVFSVNLLYFQPTPLPMKNRLFLPLFLFLFGMCGAQAKDEKALNLADLKHPVKPMLWKIEGKGLKKPSYLFGTIHLPDKRVTQLHPTAQKAFDAADTLYTEIDLSPANQLGMAKFFMRKDGKTLEEELGKSLLTELNRELAIVNPMLNAKGLNQFKTWAVAMTVPFLQDQLLGKVALDSQLWARATKADKKTGALEKPEDQVGPMDLFTAGEQKELLSVTLKVMKKSRELKVQPYQELIDAYLMGDIQVAAEIMKKNSSMGVKMSDALMAKFMKNLLHVRNRGMADTIINDLKSPERGSCFFAAGTGHYVGEKNVGEMLKAAGYQITLLQDKE
jgi:uncharacterized protein YbaP (TraB family)